MIKTIQLKQFYRNKRFIFFTILVPLFYYVLMILTSKTSFQFDSEKMQLNFLFMMYSECVLIGIIGNSLLTFGGRISSTKKFYNLYTKITSYSVWRFLCDQLVIQLVVNLTITLLIAIIGLLFSALTINFNLLFAIILLNILGIYLTIIGFVMGIYIKAENFSMMGMPLMMIIIGFTIPYHSFILQSNWFIDSLTLVQSIFPIHHFFNVLSKVLESSSFNLDLLYFFISLIVTAIPLVYLIIKSLKVKRARI